MFTFCFFLATLIVALASGYHLDAEKQEETENRSGTDSILQYMSNRNQFVGDKKIQLVKFSFNNCAAPKDEIAVLSNVQITPDPIKIPGVSKVSGNIAIKSKFGSPLQAHLDVYYKSGGNWVFVKCAGQLGSCTYTNLCTLMGEIDCPEALKKLGFQCKCPFPTGNFTISQLEVPIALPEPVKGEFKIIATVTSGGKLVTCAQIDININN